MAQDDPYSTERRTPTHPACGTSTIAIHFNGAALAIAGSGSAKGWPAVSGKPAKDGSFDYSPARQRVSNAGPLPAGNYWINPSDLWENAWYKSDSVVSWGNFRITLRIYPGTDTFGRGGFFIHGGAVPGSIGCIDLTSNMNDFVKTMRTFVGRSNNCFIPVKVEYP